MPSPTSSFRSASQYLTEAHPFARKPVTMKSAPVVWNIYPKRLARTGKAFFPFFAIVLGWPVAAEWWFNGKM
ncbi:hypothetical protein P280DRAFT_190645 [Massarina eburnea CBS 473.64]|uniref:Uncharacterized protein n=1 Tax=Massarina eburnea CBS 473.64 TaxID=1395130 RepID=A0A6A6RJW8_9PLEO|nr:hypothetical protein P280DRAFT_190645 [Massarina eburnea CBS 473.64]